MIEDMQLHGFPRADTRKPMCCREAVGKALPKITGPDQRRRITRIFSSFLKDEKDGCAQHTAGLPCAGSSFSINIPFRNMGDCLTWLVHPRRKSCRWCSASRKCAESCDSIRRLRYRVCLSTIYACGLRIPRRRCTCGSAISIVNAS